jgi:alkylation response protein AidB-like acyl-CoA dehydrogenase
MRCCICVFLLVVSAKLYAADAEPCANDVLTRLQESHAVDNDTFVEQSEIKCLIAEGGGGPCASAAGIIALQSLRLMVGLDEMPHVHKAVLESFENQKELLGGRVTNNQFVKLIEFYQKHLDGAAVTVNVESAPNSPHATGKDAWAVDGVPNLEIKPRQLKILSFTWTKEDGEVLGRHFVLMKVRDGDLLTVVDPAAPTKRREFNLEAKPCGRFFLQRPGAPNPGNATFEINTIFTIELSDSPQSVSLDEIKAKIDETAERLKKQNQLRSPRTWRLETAEFKLPALDLPADVGGLEWPAVKMIEVFRHAGRHDLNLRDVVGGAHSRVLLKSANPEVRDIAKSVAEGKAYMAIAITEPQFGSDFTSMESTATKVEGGYHLNGHKKFNARLDQATHVIIFTRSSSGKRGRLSVFVLPIDADGLEIERFGAHGLLGNSFGGLKMNDVFVPDSYRIGGEDDGYDIFIDHFRYWRLMQTATAIGTAESALDLMADRLKTRKVYGKPIGSFTHLQQSLGQYHTELAMAHALACKAAELIDSGEYKKADVLVCGLKAEGVEAALGAVDATARAFGAEGYSDLVDVGDRLQDLNGLRIADGATDVMRSAVVSKAYGSEFWKMAFKSRNDAANE